uniref:type I protein arginine methyltransferase n=1 Tax=Globodera rostochiensis TaxID=31243 RepID=A0A914H839_GLORO
MSIPHSLIVRICEFRDSDADDDDDSSAPVVERFFGKFRLIFLASNDALRLDRVAEQHDSAEGSSNGEDVDGFSSFYLALKDYEQMPITEKSIAFCRRCSTQSVPKNGTFSLNSFAIRFNTSKELATFRSILDANANRRDPKTESKQILAKLAETRSKKRKCSDESAANDSNSEFDTRTEQSSAVQYFQFYGSLFQQQNMLQDFTRTATYQRAIFENWHEFRGKVVLDVGAGTGILSFFAAQVGAKRIYAVEASSMAVHCKELVHANGYDAVISVLSAKIEEVELPEQVDVIVSEPMGYMLVNERMLESYMYARKFLRNGGRMFPSRADLHLALFSDDALHQEQQQRAAFWAQQTFHGVTLGVMQQPALDELFRQPVVDSWGAGILVSQSVKWTVDFERDPVERLHRIQVPFTMNAQRTCHVHGVASWFDVAFVGSKRTVWLSTAPTEPLTHWYQVRCLVKQPMLVLAGQDVRGRLEMVANDKQSYDMELEMCIEDNESSAWQRNVLDLKMPHFRYTGQPTAGPPGTQPECPSDQLNQAVNFFGAGGTGDCGMDQEQQQQHQQQMSAFKKQQHFACQADQPLQNGFDPRLSAALGVFVRCVWKVGRPELKAHKMVAENSESVEAVQEVQPEPKATTDDGSSTSFLYFSYGSNMLAERIHVHVTGAVFMTTAVLADFELCFFDRSERWHGAVASIERKPDTRVWGCVWRVPNSLAAELDKQECGYRRLDVDVTIHSIPPSPMRCRTYQYANPDRKLNRPSPHYRQVIITGALEHGLPSAYVEWIVNSFSTNDYRGKVELKLNAIEHLNNLENARNEHREQQQQQQQNEVPGAMFMTTDVLADFELCFFDRSDDSGKEGGLPNGRKLEGAGPQAVLGEQRGGAKQMFGVGGAVELLDIVGTMVVQLEEK